MKKSVLITATELHLYQFWIYHIKNLVNDGYKVDIVCSVVGEKLDALKLSLSEIPDVNITVVSLFRNPLQPKNLIGLNSLIKYLENHKYDFIITNEPVMGLMTRTAAFVTGTLKHTKIIYIAHGFHFSKGAPKKNWMIFYPIEKVASLFTDVIVTMNT
jgi:glycosyltransferase EpsD